MNNPRELMRDIEHNNLESGEDILTPKDLWYELCEMVEKQGEELAQKDARIARLEMTLTHVADRVHTIDEAAAFSRKALNESEPQSAAALKAEAKRKCPKCGEHSAMVRERHPDTDMNHMALACLDCGFEKEL